MKLLDDTRVIWRHYSTQALVALTTIQGVWAALPDSVTRMLPDWMNVAVAAISALIGVAGIMGKFIDQTPVDKAP